MDGVSLSSNDLRVRRFLLRVHDDQSNPLQYYVEQISHGVYGKQKKPSFSQIFDLREAIRQEWTCFCSCSSIALS